MGERRRNRYCAEVKFMRTRITGDSLRITGFLMVPCAADENVRMAMLIEREGAAGEVRDVSLDATAGWRCQFDPANAIFGFQCDIDLARRMDASFLVYVSDEPCEVRLTCLRAAVVFSDELDNLFVYNGRIVSLDATHGRVSIAPVKDRRWKARLQSRARRQAKAVRGVRFLIERGQARNLRRDKRVWVYYDSPGRLDNAWLQFQHDALIDDGIERYYVAQGVAEARVPSGSHNAKVIPFGGRTHKIVHYLADERLCSDISPEAISPWSDDETRAWYCDLDRAEQIYLQHGVLWAHLPEYYSFEVIGMDREVVSTDFEASNLARNYGFRQDALIMSGMPRYDVLDCTIRPKRKILLCPSWRGYLAGEITEQGRAPLEGVFEESSYYCGLREFLESKRLISLLEDRGWTLDFKLHPNFACYTDKFDFLCGPVKLVGGGLRESDYAIAVTDFSSYSFDFVYLKRGIVYFIPDEREFLEGANHYNALDIPLEDAFGEYVHGVDDLIDALERLMDNDGASLPRYAARQEGTFLHYDDMQRDRLYVAVAQGG